MLKISIATAFVLVLSAGCDRGPVPGSESENAPAANKAAAKPADTAASGEDEKTQPVEQVEGVVYGAPIESDEAVAIADIVKDPKAYEGKKVRVEGMVTDVCPKRGCWFDMAGSEPGQKLRFKVQDGVMTFPMDAKGKKAVAEGVVMTRQLTLEETVEYMAYLAEEKGEKFDPSSVKEPHTIVRLDGVGAVIAE